MKLNQLNKDGVIAWINVAYGSCSKSCACEYGNDDNSLLLCIHHTIYKCMKQLLDGGVKLDFECELIYAQDTGKTKIIKLLKKYRDKNEIL